MQVILQTSVPKLGQAGDVVTVKPGYYRNFLHPQGKAALCTPEAMQALEADKARLQAQDQEAFEQAKALAEQIEGLHVTLKAHTVTADKMFGSIKAADLQQALASQGIDVPKGAFRMPKGDIHQVGEYAIVVHLRHDVEVELQVTVVAQAES